jgi:hypothetical protein
LQLCHGDSFEILRTFETASFDSMVTDPPAGIGFMSKDWDHHKGGRDAWIGWMQRVMAECLRILKPGAHALVWALPRTSHWTATACENAGFEVRDVVTHLFGSGFPKSLDVGKAVAKIDRESDWKGWGTALKPSNEHWLLLRKPLSEKAVAKNVLKHGTGALNIDAGRVGGGRFPSNTLFSHHPECSPHCHAECTVAKLDSQSGILKSGGGDKGNTPGIKGIFGRSGQGGFNALYQADVGGASRFFYCAKASKSDKGMENTHPTVKSTKLMEYLITMITPPSGTILDPFMGSGSTGVAALRAGFQFVGVEKDGDYFEIALKRLS